MALSGVRPSFFGTAALNLGKRGTSEWAMSGDEACGYVESLAAFHNDHAAGQLRSALPDPIPLYVSGSRPFAQPDDLERLLGCARQHGMPVELATDAAWAQDWAAAEEILQRVGSQIHLLTISTCRSDLDTYGLSALERILEFGRRNEVGTQVLIEIDASNPLPKELFALDVINSDSSAFRVEAMAEGVRADGSDVQWPAEYLLPSPPKYARCAGLMGFVIAAGGDVYPCASSVGFAQMSLGNLRRQSVAEILAAAVGKPKLLNLRDSGPYFLYDAWQSSQRPEDLPTGYLNACDFHRRLLASEST
jgi:hypothetical protein